MLAIVDEETRKARGFASSGVDADWWRSISLDLDDDKGAIVTVVRERTPFAVFDVQSAPNINQQIADAVGARSAAFVPLVSEGRCTGVLAVASIGAAPLLAAEMELMVDLANETALALGRTRSDEALQAALDRERLVAEVSRRVRSELDLDAVLQVAVEEVGQAAGVCRCFIRLGRGRRACSRFGPSGTLPASSRSRDHAERLPVLNLAARERRTVAVDDIVTSPELDDPSLGGRETLVDLGTRAVLATPILVFDRMIGVFGLHRPEPGAGPPARSCWPRRSAARSGSRCTRPRLSRQNERRVEEQAALLKAAQVLTSDLRFEAVIQRLVDELVKLFRADAADCWIFDDARRLFRCRAVTGVSEDNVGREIPPIGHLQTGHRVRAGRC